MQSSNAAAANVPAMILIAHNAVHTEAVKARAREAGRTSSSRAWVRGSSALSKQAGHISSK